MHGHSSSQLVTTGRPTSNSCIRSRSAAFVLEAGSLPSWATGSSHTSSSRTCWCASSPLRQRRDETGHPTSVHPRRSGAGGPARAERHEGEQKNASRVKWGVPHVRCLVVWILGVDSFLSHVIACSDPCWRKTSCT